MINKKESILILIQNLNQNLIHQVLHPHRVRNTAKIKIRELMNQSNMKIESLEIVNFTIKDKESIQVKGIKNMIETEDRATIMKDNLIRSYPNIIIQTQ